MLAAALLTFGVCCTGHEAAESNTDSISAALLTVYVMYHTVLCWAQVMEQQTVSIAKAGITTTLNTTQIAL